MSRLTRKIAVPLVVLGCGAALGSAGIARAAAPMPTATTVLNVTAGDSMVVRAGGRAVRVALAGTAAPRRGECGFTASANRLRAFAPVTTAVTLRFVGSHPRASAGVVSAVVVNERGRIVNRLMVRSGFAAAIAQQGVPITRALLIDQQTAAGVSRGLWGSCGAPIPDMAGDPGPTSSTSAPVASPTRGPLSSNQVVGLMAPLLRSASLGRTAANRQEIALVQSETGGLSLNNDCPVQVFPSPDCS